MVAMAAKYSTKVEDDTMLEFKFDTQLLIEGKNLSEDVINDYITQNIENTALPWATSTMSWWKTWSARRTACKAE